MHLEHDKRHDFLVEKLPPTDLGAYKRLAKRWDHRLSYESLTQGASPLKDSSKTLNPSATIPFSTGRPTSLYFPWQSMIMAETEECRQSQGFNYRTQRMECQKGETAFDLSCALNYAEPAGCSQLVDFFRKNTGLIHNPPYQDWDTTLTCGSTSAIEMALRMFCNRGDWVLTETFTYSGTLMALRAQGLKTQGIEMDDDGLIPEDLDTKLRFWDTAQGRKPFFLYIIPSGQNPTGTTQSTARKHAIYQVAEKHDLVILEDDPYFFLRLSGSSSSLLDTRPFDRLRTSLPTSYLSLDKSGRVIRVESTSKIFAPGLRCGWLTASKQIIETFANFAEVGPSSPSGPSQVMLYKLLVEKWGQEGFVDWISHLSGEYRLRRDIMIAACEKHLPKNICTWTTPTHGMFLWVTVNLQKYPHCVEKRAEQQCDHIENKIAERAEAHGVLVARGSWFNVESFTDKVFFRMTFVATDSQENLEQGVEKFGRAVKEEFRM